MLKIEIPDQIPPETCPRKFPAGGGGAAENHVLRGQLKGRLLLSEGEKATLGWIQSGTQGALGREFAGGEQEMS